MVTDMPMKSQQFLTVVELNATAFRSRNLDLGPVTLKLNRDLDILKMCLHTENEVAAGKAIRKV